MSNLIIVAIVVFVLALAAIPAAIRAQAAPAITVTGTIEFLENGKVLHDTGVPVKTITGEATSKSPPKDDVTEQVALDCSKVELDASPQAGVQKAVGDGKTANGMGVDAGKGFAYTVRSSGGNCTYELRLPAVDATYKIALNVVGFANGGAANSKVPLGEGLAKIDSNGWNLVENNSDGKNVTTGKLPADTKTPTKVIVKAIGPDSVKVAAVKDTASKQTIVGESTDKGAKSPPASFRAVPSSVDFSVDIQ
jgi:hypothetical protein